MQIRCTHCGNYFDEGGICPCGMGDDGVDYRGLERELPLRPIDPTQVRLNLGGERQMSLVLPEPKDKVSSSIS